MLARKQVCRTKNINRIIFVFAPMRLQCIYERVIYTCTAYSKVNPLDEMLPAYVI